MADKLAAELGDLPLAAAQAAGYLEQTGLPSVGLPAPVPHPPGRAARRAATCWTTRAGSTPPGRSRWNGSAPSTRPPSHCSRSAPSWPPNPSRCRCSPSTPTCWTNPCAASPTDPDALADAVGAMVGFSLARRQPGRLPTAPPAPSGDPQPDAPRPSTTTAPRPPSRCWPRRTPATPTNRPTGPATPASPRTSWPPAHWATTTRTADISCCARSPTSATRATRKPPGH